MPYKKHASALYWWYYKQSPENIFLFLITRQLLCLSDAKVIKSQNKLGNVCPAEQFWHNFFILFHHLKMLRIYRKCLMGITCVYRLHNELCSTCVQKRIQVHYSWPTLIKTKINWHTSINLTFSCRNYFFNFSTHCI